ncbi:hypothetical protein [Burkholderia anthina]|uniref:hypothetical protein n=1 Tax=Burkholderia anthina TaxID=179879 RepID=UPI00158DC005|nr:hypothetical protein [Burkholderia anthina]
MKINLHNLSPEKNKFSSGLSRPCGARFPSFYRADLARARPAGIPHVFPDHRLAPGFHPLSGKPQASSFEYRFTLTRFEFEHRMFENDQSSDNIRFQSLRNVRVNAGISPKI